MHANANDLLSLESQSILSTSTANKNDLHLDHTSCLKNGTTSSFSCMESSDSVSLSSSHSAKNMSSSTSTSRLEEKHTSFTDQDVLSGRGGGTNLHPGNRYYRDLIFMHRRIYDRASKTEKPLVARKIVQLVRERGGNFLRKTKDGRYVDIGDEAAREKTSQALRHRTFEMRNREEPQQRAAVRNTLLNSSTRTTSRPGQKFQTNQTPLHNYESGDNDNPANLSRGSHVLGGSTPSDVLPFLMGQPSDTTASVLGLQPPSKSLDLLKELQMRENARKEMETRLLRQSVLMSNSPTERLDMHNFRQGHGLVQSEQQRLQELRATELETHLRLQRQRDLELVSQENDAARQELKLASLGLSFPRRTSPLGLAMTHQDAAILNQRLQPSLLSSIGATATPQSLHSTTLSQQRMTLDERCKVLRQGSIDPSALSSNCSPFNGNFNLSAGYS